MEQCVKEWVTIVSTNSYCQGVVCVAQSLFVVQSKFPLRCLCMSQDVSDVLQSALATLSTPVAKVIIETIGEQELMEAGASVPCLSESTALYGGQGVFLDATRRVLFKRNQSFVWVDADVLFVRNADELFDAFDTKGERKEQREEAQEERQLATVWAVPNYRIKKKCFGPDNSAKFNAGVMVVVNPSDTDFQAISQLCERYEEPTSVTYAASDAALANSNESQDKEEDKTTSAAIWIRDEEALLNEIYRGTYSTLAPVYNGIKRAYKHSPELWNELVTQGLKIIHYVGAKPWQTREERRMDWDDSDEYEALYDLWHQVREGVVVQAEDLISRIPLATQQ